MKTYDPEPPISSSDPDICFQFKNTKPRKHSRFTRDQREKMVWIPFLYVAATALLAIIVCLFGAYSQHDFPTELFFTSWAIIAFVVGPFVFAVYRWVVHGRVF